MGNNFGQAGLVEKVQEAGLCTLCGACASGCPYFKSWEGRIVKLDSCDLDKGRCLLNCPRFGIDWEFLQAQTFGPGEFDLEVGRHLEIVTARSLEPQALGRTQNGGVVSSLIRFGLGSGRLSAAVLTKPDEKLLAQGRVVRSADQVLDFAGSSYVAGPTLEAFNREDWAESDSVGIVGVPCQMTALAKMGLAPNREVDPQNRVDKVGLTIGLFCTWALAWQPLVEFFADRLAGRKMLRSDITPPPERLFKVFTEDGTVDIPIDEVRPFIRTGCHVCPDLTSELADISVGTVEGEPGWNSVILRNERGRDFFRAAVGAGVLEAGALPKENQAHLKFASKLKKKRALAALEERGELDSGYLTLSAQARAEIMKGATQEGSGS